MESNNNLYFRVLNLGIDENTPSNKALKIKIVNGFASVASVILFIATGIVIVMNLKKISDSGTSVMDFFSSGNFPKSGAFILFDFLGGLVCLMVLVLNRMKKYNTAIFLLLLTSNLIVGYYYWLKGIVVAFYFFIPVLIPVVLFTRKTHYIVSVLASVALMYILTFTMNGNDMLFRMPSTDTPRLFIHFLNFTITFLIIFLIAYHFKVENLRNEKALTNKNMILEFQAEEIRAQRDELAMTKTELESKNTNITDSINYAKNIQTALLPSHELLDEILPDHFILLRPRDIVSGDFYWFTYIENLSVIAAVDCTGHGVPGAFMSMLGSAFLNEIVNKEYITHPGVILRRLRKEVIRSLHQKGEAGDSKDGMDLSVCVIDNENKKLQFAGANNPLYLVRKKDEETPGDFLKYESNGHSLYEIKGDRLPVSAGYSMENYKMHELDFLRGDLIYLFSDGYADQFGGPAGKKFGYRNFKNLLLDNSSEPLEVQRANLERNFDEWKGSLSQVDDMMVMGIRL